MQTPLIFDGHNDVLTRLMRSGDSGAFLAGDRGHIDLPRAQAGGWAGGFFAVWVPSEDDPTDHEAMMSQPSYDIPLPPMVAPDRALRVVLKEVAILRDLEARGALRVCTSVADIRACLAGGIMAAILHMEGAEAIDPDLDALEVLYSAGLRSLGPVWSRETIFGHGVPFAYPSDPDRGPGLTEAGKRLVARCDALGVMLDLSHLNEAGFWDVVRLSQKPLVATHSNAHAISPHARNLTDDQLRAIAESDGVVGLNFATAFLRSDGQMTAATSLDTMLRHLDHLLEHLGEGGVALGSDYDGATVPEALNGAEKLPRLIQVMVDHGYGDELITRICYENWMRVLEKTWGV